MYAFRCTEQQLNAQLERIAEAGDVVFHPVYKGGRDWVLFCDKAGERALTQRAFDTEVHRFRDDQKRQARRAGTTAS